MTGWVPPKTVSKKEMVGRRAFGSKVFEQAKDNVLHYKIDVFLDDRLGTGLSIDRLGVRTARPEVLTLLAPLCDQMADKRSTSFVGWAQFRVDDVRCGIAATDPVSEDNPYHAEIDRSHYQNVAALRSLAFELCVHASKHAFIDRSAAVHESHQ
jgi:hypothetical protein